MSLYLPLPAPIYRFFPIYYSFDMHRLLTTSYLPTSRIQELKQHQNRPNPQNDRTNTPLACIQAGGDTDN